MNSFRSRVVKNRFILVLFLLIYPVACLAGSWEYCVEPKVKVPLSKDSGLYLDIKEETRFKDGRNYYDKTFWGLSKELKKDIELSFYGAMVKEKKANNWGTSYLVWPELGYKHRLGEFELNSNAKLEYFFSNDEWRFREQISVTFPINNRLSFWLGDEPRLFSFFEGAYFGENEALAGFIYNLKKDLALNIFYDLRSIKQSANWESTNCLRVAFNLTF